MDSLQKSKGNISVSTVARVVHRVKRKNLCADLGFNRVTYLESVFFMVIDTVDALRKGCKENGDLFA